MKLKITKEGNLWIERSGDLKLTLCPFACESTYCGHWCPLFGEPEEEMETVHRDSDGNLIDYLTIGGRVEVSKEPTGQHTITLCHGTVLKGELVDERA